MHIGYWWARQNARSKETTRKIRRVDNNKLDLREMGWGHTDWIDLVQYREEWRALMNTAMNLRGLIKCSEILE
jgi:hypothetical protein